jgi:hypothetical protein
MERFQARRAMKNASRVLFLGLPLFLLMAVSCGKKDVIASVKQGHFQDAPKITVEEILGKYRYTDPSSIVWEKVLDENKNEYVRATIGFENADILTASLAKRVVSYSMDYVMIWEYLDRFFYETARSDNAEILSDEGVTQLDIRVNHYPADVYDQDKPSFFKLKGGKLSADFPVNDKQKGVFEIGKARIVFNFESPDQYGNTMKYSVGIPLRRKLATDILLDNADIDLSDMLDNTTEIDISGE